MKNQYDGRPFSIQTLDAARTGQGYIVCGGLPTAAIRGAEPGQRYQLAVVHEDGITFSGDSADFIEGPLVGEERAVFLAKRGGVSTGDPAKDVAPWPGWGIEEFEALLVEPIECDPRSPAPEPEAEPEAPAAPDTPAAPAPVVEGTEGDAPEDNTGHTGTSAPDAEPTKHEGLPAHLVDEAKELLEWLAREVNVGAHSAYHRLRDLLHTGTSQK